MRSGLKMVYLKNGYVFNGEKIYVQSMLNRPADNLKENLEQAKELEDLGCHIIRVAVPKLKDVKLVSYLKKHVSCPIVCDVHFNYKIALAAIENGVDKIRINPGNINKKDLEKIVYACKKNNLPIRVGINSGSLETEILKEKNTTMAQKLLKSAIKTVELFEDEFNFSNIVVSIKSSNVLDVVFACEKFRRLKNNPLHIGVTEAGLKEASLVKSSIAIGALLLNSIGETIRVSITGDPKQEVKAAYLILNSLGLEKKGIEIIACPTCGRTKINIIKIAKQVEKELKTCKKHLKVAIMGCVVNGPGEAKSCDVGIAGGDGFAVLFKKGEILKKNIPQEDVVRVLVEEVKKM